MLSNYQINTRLELATRRGDYEYWLTQEDIADIARINYQNYKPVNEENSFKAFDIIGSPEQLLTQVESFQLRAQHLSYARLALIINIEQLHWVTLIITYQDATYKGYFVDSLGGYFPENYQRILKQSNLDVINLSQFLSQQTDDFNCGLWALENTELLTRLLDDKGKGPHWILKELKRTRDTEYLSEQRRILSTKLINDPVRQARPIQTEQPIFVKNYAQSFAKTTVTSPALNEPQAKKIKLVRKEEVFEKQDLFVKLFIEAYATRLAGFKIRAKGERITIEGLISEAKTSFLGILWGVGMAQSPAGSIPPVVAVTRNVGLKHFTKKKRLKHSLEFSQKSAVSN